MMKNEMAAKYWGEEKEPEAIYAIYLRKVRYRAPNVLAGVTHHRHYDQEKDGHGSPWFGSDHLQWETVKERVVKAASLKKLVQCLVHNESNTTNSGDVDTRHFNVFFATYRAFAKPFDVLRLILVELYSILNKSPDDQPSTERHHVLLASWRNVLLCWLELYPDDFRDPPKYACLTQLIEFSRNYQTSLQDVFVQAVRKRDKFCRDLSAIKLRPFVEKCSLLSPLDGFDYLFTSKSSKSPDVSHTEPGYVAEQLTYWDAELFKRLIPHQCQSCFWSRRNKEPNSSENVYTVKATIDQFNAVSRRVMASVVSQPHAKASYRAKVVSNWIDIAQELRILKNFSSLKSVLSGLQSEPVYRLRNVWALVSSDKIKEFNELSRIFSEDDNHNGARSILEKEGTAKAAIGVFQENGGKEKSQRKIFRHRRTKSEMGEIQGTVPYLGTFLTDLTMIDAAYPDNTEEGLINFEKRRREFDVIAQLRLFQSSARNYHIISDPKFRTWFIHLPNLSEQQCYHLSCVIEPPARQAPQPNSKTKQYKQVGGTFSKLFFRDSNDGPNSVDHEDRPFYFYGSTAPSVVNGQSGNSVFYEPAQFSANALWSQWNTRRQTSPSLSDARSVSGNGSMPNGCGPKIYETNYSKSSSLETPSSQNTSSCSASDIYGFYNSPFFLEPPATSTPTPSPTSASKMSVFGSGSVDEPEFYVVRVSLEKGLQSDIITMTTMYKCVKLENRDHTYHLIDKVLQKHQLDGDPADFWIVQMLPDGDELVLPEKGNAFYAVSPSMEMNFELRRKTSQTPTTLRIKKKKRKSRERKYGGNLLRWSSGFL